MKQETAHETMNVEGGAHIKMWTRGVPVEAEAREQLAATANMPFTRRPPRTRTSSAVMNAQQDLVEVVHTLKQVVCVKG